MRTATRRAAACAAIIFVLAVALTIIGSWSFVYTIVEAQNSAGPVPTPTPGVPPIAEQQFDQAAALAKLREQIKGREQEPASKVFKNIKMLTNMPAGRVLSVMEFGYSRSLGVTCTHCHVADKWESDESPNKGIARDMVAMTARINTELLRGIKNLSQNPTVNCTTCHRGQTKPATNMQPRS